jgi:hypothetical protein
VEQLITEEEAIKNNMTQVEIDWLNAAHALAELYFNDKNGETAYLNTPLMEMDSKGTLQPAKYVDPVSG